MVQSPTFYAYIVRQFLFWFAAALLVLSGVIAVFEFVEFVRQVSARPELPLSLAFTMAAFKLPSSIEILFHFAVLIAAMVTFWRMTRSRELIVARAAGLSAWQFLAPVIVAAMVLGVVKIALVNPISAAMYGRYERLDVDYLGGTGDIMKVVRTGFWLRQKDENGIAVIHAERVSGNGDQLENAMFLLLSPDESYRGRIDGASARLQDGNWIIRNAWVIEGNAPAEHFETYPLPSNLTRDGIQERFASPQTISFWDLPEYVRSLDATGFASTRYRIAYQSLLAQPLLMAAMILVAAAFSLRPGRRVDAVLMIVGAIVTGFSIFVLGDIVMALGRAGTLPVPMAAWATSGVALLFGVAALLHLEDG